MGYTGLYMFGLDVKPLITQSLANQISPTLGKIMLALIAINPCTKYALVYIY
jgi:hypothetical protein